VIRDLLYKWFKTPQGKVLRHNESLFLRRNLSVTSMQCLLQIGFLGWERDFLNGYCAQNSFIMDSSLHYLVPCSYLVGQPYLLPFETESIDFVILPHFLEFADDFSAILDEVDRVLKPEGEVIIIGFNPWSWFASDYSLARTLNKISLPNHALSRAQLSNRLLSLDYEVEKVAGFDCRKHYQVPQEYRRRAESYFVTAYALRGIKRCHNVTKLDTLDRYLGLSVVKPI